MPKPVILITGANGQLGKEFRVLADAFPGLQFVFLSREDLPIHHFPLVRHFFEAYKPDYCINCAAYTAVDKAESEKDLAYLINAEAVGYLAAACKDFQTRFIHVSTDYVFDGMSPVPYKETDPVAPVNLYGASKLAGEEACLKANPEALIIRTSWVYSEFGHNFVRTMLRLMIERPEIRVVNDQIGAPTYAADLAQAILQIVDGGMWHSGIYHYSNAGRISWYDFAMSIKEITGSLCNVIPIVTSEYPTPARRPLFSLLDTSKFKADFKIAIPGWRESLAICLNRLGYS